MTTRRGCAADDRGQSLVELALALPILLLIVLGIVDIGRIYAFKVATTNAAREAAIYAARDPQATVDRICQRARDELGAGVGTCNTAPITVTCSRRLDIALDTWTPCGNDTSMPRLYQTDGAGGASVSINVRYDVSLLTAYLISRAFPVNPVVVGATAAFDGLGE